MPAYDICHDQVVRALEKEGWKSIKVPYRTATPDRVVYIDAQLARGNNGNQRQILLLEVKCFLDEDSTTTDLYGAIGQYLIYRAMLVERKLKFPLYLSVPETIFRKVFDPVVSRVIKEQQIKLIVIDLNTESITRWIE
jgi:hypothetical protein